MQCLRSFTGIVRNALTPHSALRTPPRARVGNTITKMGTKHSIFVEVDEQLCFTGTTVHGKVHLNISESFKTSGVTVTIQVSAP